MNMIKTLSILFLLMVISAFARADMSRPFYTPVVLAQPSGSLSWGTGLSENGIISGGISINFWPGFAGAVWPDPSTPISMTTLFPPTTNGVFTGIHAAGDALIGYHRASIRAPILPFLFVNGQVVDLPISVAGSSGGANALNRNFRIVGQLVPPSGPLQAVAWDSRGVTDLSIQFSSGDSQAVDINNQNVIVGNWLANPNDRWKAIQWVQDAPSVLPCNQGESRAYAINDLNITVGSCGPDAVMWLSNQTAVPLGVNGFAVDINLYNEVIIATPTIPYLFVPGMGRFSLDSLIPSSFGIRVTGVVAINNRGDILGHGFAPGGGLLPVPIFLVRQ